MQNGINLGSSSKGLALQQEALNSKPSSTKKKKNAKNNDG
jgi:hypothetical protein